MGHEGGRVGHLGRAVSRASDLQREESVRCSCWRRRRNLRKPRSPGEKWPGARVRGPVARAHSLHKTDPSEIARPPETTQAAR